MNPNFTSYETAKLNRAEIISDYFDDQFGRWANPAALDAQQRQDLLNQNHVDLRGFILDDYKDSFLVDLMSSTMSSLASTSVGSINAPILVSSGESWSNLTSYSTTGTSSIDSSGKATLTIGSNHGITVNDTIKISNLDANFNGTYLVSEIGSTTISYLTSSATASNSNTGTVTLLYGTANSWKSLKIKCAASANQTIEIYCKASPVDINNYATDGFITIALPNFSTNIAKSSTISFTTDSNGDFTNLDQTNSFSFNDVTLNYQTNNTDNSATNNVELKIATSSLNKIFSSTNPNKGLITSIKFTLSVPVTACWFYCAAIRCVSSTWKYAPIDINTVEDAVVKTAPLNGGGVIQTTLVNNPLSSTDTTCLVADSTNFPDFGTILIDNEFIYYGSKNSTNKNVLNIIRGTNKSAAASHSNGATVTLYDFNFSVNNIGSRMPVSWPVIYKTFDNLGFANEQDPQILNGSVYAVINIGSTIDQNTYNGSPTSSTNYNEFVFYFRNSSAAVVQSDLNKFYSQGNLNTLNQNIDNLYSLYIKNTQSDLSKIKGSLADNSLPSGNTGTYQDNPNNLPVTPGKTQGNLSIIPGAVTGTINGQSYQINSNNLPNQLGINQQNLNESVNTNHISYASTSLRWYKSSSNLQFDILLGDEVANSFTFSTTTNLNYWKNKTLVFKSSLNDKKFQCQLFELKNSRLYPVFDTGQIENDFFHKNRGRFGWGATLVDGTSKIRSIRSGGLIYGEYKSNIMNSYTPVKGAQVFSNQTPDKELVTSVGSNPWSTNTNSVTSQIDNTDPKKSVIVYNISDPNTKIWQGVITNKFKIENFENFYATFDIKYNSTTNNLLTFLYQEKYNRLFPLNVPPFNSGQWQSLKLISSNNQLLPGTYSLAFVENGYNNNTPWSIKNISVKEQMLIWSGRSFVDGPWDRNDRDWVPDYFVNTLEKNTFSKTTNVNDGMVFAKSDTELQIRAEARSQYMEIDNFDVVPKYATLGNFVWRDN